jgi:hypothetical protein
MREEVSGLISMPVSFLALARILSLLTDSVAGEARQSFLDSQQYF